MDGQLILIFLLTFIIHLIRTLAYSVRIAGTHTGRIAVSLSLFNILVLISRPSNSFQSPLLAKENLRGAVATGMDQISVGFFSRPLWPRLRARS